MVRRVLWRALATMLGAAVGTSLLSGSGQPVTALPYPRWQELAPPPLSARAHALGLRVGHRVLILGGGQRAAGLRGGVRGGGRGGVRGGASYDMRTGLWHRVSTPMPVTDRDRAVAAAGVVVLRQERGARPASWWRYDVRLATWTRIGHLPGRLSAPTAFASEVYALSGRRVEVYSVGLGRWTPLPADPLRPLLRHRRITVSRAGTVVTGRAGPRSPQLADRWDGLRWRRTHARTGETSPPTPALPAGSNGDDVTEVALGGRLLVVAGGRAWMHTP